MRAARFGGLRPLSVGAGHGWTEEMRRQGGQERYKTTDFLPVSVLHFRARQRRPWGGRRAFDHHRERTTTMASTRVYPTTIFPTIGRRNAVLMFLMGLGLILAIGWFINGISIEPTNVIDQQVRYLSYVISAAGWIIFTLSLFLGIIPTSSNSQIW